MIWKFYWIDWCAEKHLRDRRQAKGARALRPGREKRTEASLQVYATLIRISNNFSFKLDISIARL